ncbi:hypothetical protein [Agrobacterium pusense]|uniref:hypothetical protein n=1 Tax=Agrobacterium pusense TaxID=648995 RepID=UPI0024486E37|nr:hypothetical protein [Agrobacterium pusense]MDH0869725.1 hypothetical protein [Agrobacterium pusense]
MTSWQPIETAPKDGTWIVGFCGGKTLYVVMRWWDGIMPEDDDDLTTDEVGDWVVSGDVSSDEVTHWTYFDQHPSAPTVTTSFDHYDADNGIKHRSRAERGVTGDQQKWSRKFHQVLSDLSMETDLGFEEMSDIAERAADAAVPGVKWENAA